ncbi:MAG: YraN family protein, partial [Deltaproteobacteria bacterium]
VKVRSGRLDPLEAVDERKQRHLSRVAFDFLKRHGMLGRPARFDVVAVDGKTLECTHVADAFDVALDY